VSGGGFFPDGVDVAAAHVVVGVALSTDFDQSVLLQLLDGPADRVAVEAAAQCGDGLLLGPGQCVAPGV
jgi:predicted DsbA family dithiol-disulfide isomerase